MHLFSSCFHFRALLYKSGTFFTTTAPAPIVELLPTFIFSTIHTDGPMYTLLPMTAAFPSIAPIVVNCDIVQLLPITADGLIIVPKA